MVRRLRVNVERFVSGKTEQAICWFHYSLLFGDQKEFKVKHTCLQYDTGNIFPVVAFKLILPISADGLVSVDLDSHVALLHIVGFPFTVNTVSTFYHKIVGASIEDNIERVEATHVYCASPLDTILRV